MQSVSTLLPPHHPPSVQPGSNDWHSGRQGDRSKVEQDPIGSNSTVEKVLCDLVKVTGNPSEEYGTMAKSLDGRKDGEMLMSQEANCV